MIAWLWRMLDRRQPEPTPENTEERHKATLRRADRLLRVVADYRKAEEARREHR